MLKWLPYGSISYKKMVAKLARRTSSRPVDFKPMDNDLARIHSFIENLPHIAHVMVNGMKESHVVGLVHYDLHNGNISLDSTRDSKCKLGIIDWGLMLLEGQHWPSILYITKYLEDLDPVKDI